MARTLGSEIQKRRGEDKNAGRRVSGPGGGQQGGEDMGTVEARRKRKPTQLFQFSAGHSLFSQSTSKYKVVENMSTFLQNCYL